MTRTRGCRARPGPVLAVEAFIGEHPGIYRPEELADIFAVTALPPAVVKEVLAHLLGIRAGRPRQRRPARPSAGAEPA